MPRLRIPLSLAAIGLLFTAAGHAAPTVKTVEAKAVPVLASVAPARGAVLTELRSAFADGERIGSLHAGADCAVTDDRPWSELVRQRIESEAANAFRHELAKMQPAGRAGTTAAPLKVQAFLNDVDVAVCQAGAGAWQGGFYVQVSWQIVSPESGKVVYQASTEGSYLQPSPQRVSTASALRQALGVAVRNLMADRRFAGLLQHDQRRLVLAGSI